MKKKTVEILLEDDITNKLYGNLSEVINNLKQLDDKHGNLDLEIDLEQYYEGFTFKLIGRRLETDEEYAERMEIIKKNDLKNAEKRAKRITKLEKELENLRKNADKVISEKEEKLTKLKGK